MARAVSSPFFELAGDPGPIPPDIGKSGYGVITRIAVPTWNSPRAGPIGTVRNTKKMTALFVLVIIGFFMVQSFWRHDQLHSAILGTPEGASATEEWHGHPE
jgi:hypothetical protein